MSSNICARSGQDYRNLDQSSKPDESPDNTKGYMLMYGDIVLTFVHVLFDEYMPKRYSYYYNEPVEAVVKVP